MTTRVNWGVLSTAKIGRLKVIPALQSVESAALVGVSSRDKDRAQAFVDTHCNTQADDGGGGSHCVGMTHDEVLSSSSIEAVYVPLPSRVRSEFIIKALKSGKHV